MMTFATVVGLNNRNTTLRKIGNDWIVANVASASAQAKRAQ